MATSLYTQAEFNAAVTAVKALEAKDVPWYEQGAITDQLIDAVVDAVLTAAAKAREGQVVTARKGHLRGP
jgi:hypothetical protein